MKIKFKLCPDCKELVPRAPGHFQFGIKEAAKNDFVAIEPEPNELQIDLDGPKAMRIYSRQFYFLKQAGLTKRWKETITPSKSKNHMHITIKTPFNFTRSPSLRICFQAILSSDIKREAFNLIRSLTGAKFPILFFEEEKSNGNKKRRTSKRK